MYLPGGDVITLTLGLYSLRNITNNLFQADIGKPINGGNMFVEIQIFCTYFMYMCVVLFILQNNTQIHSIHMLQF